MVEKDMAKENIISKIISNKKGINKDDWEKL